MWEGEGGLGGGRIVGCRNEFQRRTASSVNWHCRPDQI